MARSVPEALSLLQAVREEVRRRRSLLIDHGVPSYLDLPPGVRPDRLLVCADELPSLLTLDPESDPPDSPELIEAWEQTAKDNADRKVIGQLLVEVALMGRAFGVHLVLISQRPHNPGSRVFGWKDLVLQTTRLGFGNFSPVDRAGMFRNPFELPEAAPGPVPRGRALLEKANQDGLDPLRTGWVQFPWASPREFAAALAERDVPHADLLPGFVADAG